MGSRKNNFGIRPPLHPRWLRRSSLTYRGVCAVVAPCPRGASTPSVLRTYSCANPEHPARPHPLPGASRMIKAPPVSSPPVDLEGFVPPGSDLAELR